MKLFQFLICVTYAFTSYDNIFQILLNNIIGINQKRGFVFDLFIIIVIYANEIQYCLNFDILNICICVLQKSLKSFRFVIKWGWVNDFKFWGVVSCLFYQKYRCSFPFFMNNIMLIKITWWECLSTSTTMFLLAIANSKLFF